MSKFITLAMTMEQAYIFKHTLRDKENRDEAEEALLAWITDQIDSRRDALNIPKKG